MMYRNFIIQRIAVDRIDEFLAILKELAIWLKENGNEMWNIEALEARSFIENNKDAELYLCFINNEPAGAFMLKEENKFWWPNATDGESIFLKKLGVRRAYAGKGVSTYIIEWVKRQVKERNRKFLRIEFYADIEYLCKLYKNSGFKSVKEMVMPDGTRIALYEYEVE